MHMAYCEALNNCWKTLADVLMWMKLIQGELIDLKDLHWYVMTAKF